MYIYIYIYSICVYIYIYILCVYIYMYIYIYIYIYIFMCFIRVGGSPRLTRRLGHCQARPKPVLLYVGVSILYSLV